MRGTPRNPGELNQVVSVQVSSNTTPAGGSGQKVESWSTSFQRWGMVTPNNGTEKFQQHQIQGNVTHIVRLNNDESTRAITNKNRLTVNGHTLGILAAYDDEFDTREMVLHCEEVT